MELMPDDKKKILFTFILIISFLIGCSPVLRYKVLSVFFDGVPDPSMVVVSLPKTDTIASKMLAIKEMEPEFYYHQPYQKNECVSCHDKGFSNKLIKPQPELCYGCHEDWNNKYKTLHGPVASGYCTACHSPHMSKLKKMLLRENQQLCLHCHNSKHVDKNKVHEHIGERNCTECHNPHGGENRGILKPGSCYNCHDDFNAKYNVLHGPVASGYCTACHSSHATKEKKLLLRSGQQICLYCHDQKQILKNVAHENIKESNCTECHNPHGGEDRYILIRSALSSTASPNNQQSAIGNKQLYLIAANGDTLMAATPDKKGNFVFEKLPPVPIHTITFSGVDTALVQNTQIIFKDKSGKNIPVTLTRDSTGVFKYENLPFAQSKLHLLSLKGDTLMMAVQNEKGKFVFEKNPPAQSCIFSLESTAPGFFDNIEIVFTGTLQEGGLKTMNISKGSDNLFRYEQPEIARIYLRNKNGDTLAAAFRNSKRFFAFRNLPAEENMLLALEATDTATMGIKIHYHDSAGKEKITSLTKGKDGYFRFKRLPYLETTLFMLNTEGDTIASKGEKVYDRDILKNIPKPSGLITESDKIVILFNFDSSIIPWIYYDSLQKILKNTRYKSNHQFKILIEGHADNIGTIAANEVLSKKRAETVKRKLMEFGLKEEKIIIKYYGELRPIAPYSMPDGSDNKKGRQQNRRAELMFVR